MDQPIYKVEYLPTEDQYLFESFGKNGSIFKIVIFTEIQKGVFNLGFGDLNTASNLIDDKSNSDNGDMPKVFSNCNKYFI